MMDEISPSSKVPYWCQVYAALVSLNSANIGYDLGVNTGLVASFERTGEDVLTLSHYEIEMYMGSLAFTSILGSLMMFSVAEPYGRRGVLALTQLILLVGLSINALSSTVTGLVIGRSISGFALGLGFSVDPVYIAEIAPKNVRGRLVSWSESGTNVGILIGFVMGYLTRNVTGNAQWRILVATGAILPVIMLALVHWVLPESPRWLVKAGKMHAATQVLISCSADPETADGAELLRQLEADLAEESKLDATSSWSSLLLPINRRKLLAGAGVSVAGALTGITGIQYYMISVFSGAGITSKDTQFKLLIVVGVVKLIVISIGGLFFDKFGRRPILIFSNLGLSFSLLLIASSEGILTMNSSTANGAIGFTAVLLYVSAFSMGIGPGAWLIPSEVFSNDIRPKAMSVSSFCNRSVATIIGSTFLSMYDSWGAGAFVFFALTTLLSAIFISKYVPESKGLSLEQMHQTFVDFQPRKICAYCWSDRDVSAPEPPTITQEVELSALPRVDVMVTNPLR